jgi:3-oxoacyl-[acyl-carrier protein] reductase
MSIGPNSEEQTMSRKAALITGGASGIGRSTVLALAEAGFDVAINYSKSDDAAAETAAAAGGRGARVVTIRGDVSDDSAVHEMVATLEHDFGRLDALINNAGTTTENPPEQLDEMSLETWDRIFAVNVRGVFQVTRAFAPLLRANAPSAVVNTGSIVGLRPTAQPLAYAASKAAVLNLTKTLARVLAPEVRVNAVAPGWIAGDWMEKALGEHYDGLIERRARQTPLLRVATPDDVAESIVSLIVSNRFVTGQTLIVDGGYASST